VERVTVPDLAHQDVEMVREDGVEPPTNWV